MQMTEPTAASAGERHGAEPGADPAHLDVLDPAFRVDSAEVRAAAARHWYATTPLGPAVLRHADCVALLRDRRLIQGSSDHLAAQGVTEGPLADMWRSLLMCIDGPDHTRLRRLVGRAFSAGAVDRLRPRMRQIVHDLVDGVAAAGQCEFMGTVADRYPTQVMFELLGFPPADHEPFLGWGKEFAHLFSFSVAERAAGIEAAMRGLYQAVDRLAGERRRRPTDDLFSHLVAASDGDDRLTMDELKAMVLVLVLGGHDTTRGQLGNALVTFSEHPDQWALLARRPELAARAVEEIIRVHSVIPIVWRLAAEDLTYRDLAAPAGTRLWLMVHTAHRQEAVYGPGGFDITVDREPQINFGGGVHYCVGAHLARAELAEALPVLAARWPRFELAGSPSLRPELSGIRGPESLPIRFEAAPRTS